MSFGDFSCMLQTFPLTVSSWSFMRPQKTTKPHHECRRFFERVSVSFPWMRESASKLDPQSTTYLMKYQSWQSVSIVIKQNSCSWRVIPYKNKKNIPELKDSPYIGPFPNLAFCIIIIVYHWILLCQVLCQEGPLICIILSLWTDLRHWPLP